jgi:hypothetical protein
MEYGCTITTQVAGWLEELFVEFEIEFAEAATGLDASVEIISVTDENDVDVYDKMSAAERWILEGKCMDRFEEEMASMF